MKNFNILERRKFVRLRTAFPVGFQFISPDGRRPLSQFMQGYTADVSKGGILLRVNNITHETARLFRKVDARLLLEIEMPVGSKPVEVIASVAWARIMDKKGKELCAAGLSFEKINEREKRKLFAYAISISRVPRLLLMMLFLAIILLGAVKLEEMNLRKENTLLVSRLSGISEKRGAIVESLNKSGQDRAILMKKIEYLTMFEKKLKESQGAKAELEAKLRSLAIDREMLRKQLENLRTSMERRREELRAIAIMHENLEEAAVENMYNWLRVHQNKRTGLIASYEGDENNKNAAFTYDQALAAQVFLLNDDIKSAELILDFFSNRAKKRKKAFTNAYSSKNGSIVEYAVHSGPNLWIGITALQYIYKTEDRQYLRLAERIAQWVMDIQKESEDGGIKGGPESDWFSTEHNLDAYAFFNMMYIVTEDEEYKKAAQKCLNWFKDHAYTDESGRIYRGKGDSTIATDTFAWAIASIGPKLLLKKEMDPRAIMNFAEENCRVEVNFTRPNGKVVRIAGFDFAKQKHSGRGGVVSSEWTAQMAVSFKLMSDFYHIIGEGQIVKEYWGKYEFYINELEKMIITSPSRSGQGAGCLPYATQDDVDTGHGWRTPRGRDTGSVSGTAYYIFAIEGYNPLSLDQAIGFLGNDEE